MQVLTSASSLLPLLVVCVGIMQNAKCCYAKYKAKWICKVMDIPQNCKTKTVATCSTTDGNSSCHGLTPPFFEEMTSCRRQKHRRRWPGNPNGRLKFRKYRIYLSILCLFTSTRSWLVLRDWRQWQVAMDSRHRFSKNWHVADVKNIACNDQDRSKFRNYKNVYQRDQIKPLEKHLFAVRTPVYDSIVHCFFATVTCQRLLFSPTKTNFSTTLTPPKNRDINIEEFFCRFYL